MAAFAGESQARNKYTYFASKAKKDGYEQIAAIFEETFQLKKELKEKVSEEEYNIEQIYIELKKIFILRKNYLEMPIKETQEAILEITNYELYNEMSVEEVESAIRQVTPRLISNS